ncbi:MAG: hypothetical protein IPL53_00125 [Ignavibacteria bacterium]|nr:hypothetical protein [Ignavibacteria bacterium]
MPEDLFTTAGGETVNGIAKWDGSAWNPVSSGVSGYIKTITFFENEMYLGGGFKSAGSQKMNNITKWNGTVFSPLSAPGGNGFNGIVNAMVNNSESDLFACGSFSSPGNTDENNNAKWNCTSWSALTTSLNAEVKSLAAHNNVVYVGGSFTTAGGINANNIAKWDGNNWSPLDNGLNGTVDALAMIGSDLFAGGNFTEAGGTSVNYIAKWNGSSWN